MNNSILRQIPSEAQIRKELRRNLFGKRLFCPNCGSGQIKKYEKRYHCKTCRKHFSLTSINWLKSAKLPLRTIWLLLWAWTKKVPLDQAARIAGVSEVTSRRWYDKFRDNLPKDKLDNVRLQGTVQMDEAYRGPKNNRYSLVGAKQKAQKGRKKKIVIKVLHKSSVDRKDALGFISQYIVPNSIFNIDGAAIYRGIDKWWKLDHHYECHNQWEFTLTSEIEGLWGNLTTFIRRMYHHVTANTIESIVEEFLARSMYPEWFYTPSHFLNVSLVRVKKLKRPEWRGQYQIKKKRKRIFLLSKTGFQFKIPEKSFTFVPSC
jgi:transposase-like protein